MRQPKTLLWAVFTAPRLPRSNRQRPAPGYQRRHRRGHRLPLSPGTDPRSRCRALRAESRSSHTHPAVTCLGSSASPLRGAVAPTPQSSSIFRSLLRCQPGAGAAADGGKGAGRGGGGGNAPSGGAGGGGWPGAAGRCQRPLPAERREARQAGNCRFSRDSPSLPPFFRDSPKEALGVGKSGLLANRRAAEGGACGRGGAEA